MSRSRFPWKLVTFDIDGTLTMRHGWAHIAEALGRTEAYLAATERFRNGETGEDEHLEALLALAEGVPMARFERALASTHFIGSVSETVEEMHRRGSRVALLTHNPPYVCRWYQRTFGFDDFEGVNAPGPVRGRLIASGPVHADKPGQLGRLLARTGVDARRVVHVGDGLPDAEIFPRIGGGIALNARNPAVRAAADAVADVDDLRALWSALERLAPRA